MRAVHRGSRSSSASRAGEPTDPSMSSKAMQPTRGGVNSSRGVRPRKAYSLRRWRRPALFLGTALLGCVLLCVWTGLPFSLFSSGPTVATPGADTPDIRQEPQVNPPHKTDNEDTMMRTRIARRVVVVGSGLAGQSAAIEAARRGADVLLLEKESRLGGNSAKATSGINAWGTPAQKALGVEDGAKYFESDTYRSGRGGNCEPGLVRMLSVKSADAIQFLSSFGVPLTVLSQLGGASRKRCHRAPDKEDGTPLPIGFTIVSTLEKQIRGEFAEKVTIETNARLLRLINEERVMSNGDVVTVVTGVEYEKSTPPAKGQPPQPDTEPAKAPERVTYATDAVILATGGFSNDHTDSSLLQEYAPQLASFPTTNGPWATGDGVKMARELGVQLVDMDKVQLHPTGLLNPKDPRGKTVFLGPEALRGSGGILVNKNGERFVNELDLRSVVSQAIIAQNNEYPESDNRRFAYCVLNEAAATAFGRGALGFYWKKMGLFQFAEDVPALAKLIGCAEDHLQRTLMEYEEVSTSKARCPITGKTVYPCPLGPQGPFYVAYVTPSIHYTMGGCLISPTTEMQSQQVKPFGSRLPILGLYGAGEVTGGVHGGNRLGGNSLLECVVFGRIAGQRAATGETTETGSPALSTSSWTPVTVREVISEGDAEEAGPFRGGRQVVFSLPSAFQSSGLSLLQTANVRVRRDGQTRVLAVQPSSPPNELGSLAVYLPADHTAQAAWLYHLQAGDEVEVQAGAFPGSLSAETIAQAVEKTNQLHIIALAPNGVAPLLQLLRTALEKPWRDHLSKVHVTYAAENVTELSYRKVLEACSTTDPTFLTCKMIVDDPPAKWVDGVGVIDEDVLHMTLPSAASPSERAALADTTIAVLGSNAETGPILSYLQTKGYTDAARVIAVSL